MVRDWGTAIVTQFQDVLGFIIGFLPRLLGFLVILIIGLIVANLLAKATTALLRRLGFDRLADRIGLTRLEQNMGVKMDAASLLGRVVYWFILLIFLVPATDSLGLAAVSNTINTLVAYIPNVFAAILILFLASLAANILADIVRGAAASARLGNPSLFANITRWSIIGFGGLIALEQLNIAPALLNVLFTAIVGGLALAFGLSFGLGGQDAARRLLNRSENAISTGAQNLNANQTQGSIETRIQGQNVPPRAYPGSGTSNAYTSVENPQQPPRF